MREMIIKTNFKIKRGINRWKSESRNEEEQDKFEWFERNEELFQKDDSEAKKERKERV